MLSFFRRHKILSAFLILVILSGLWLFSRTRGPHHHYELDFLIPDPAVAVTPGQLEVGVAIRDVSPDFNDYDPWVDVNENGKWDPGIDTYEDRTGTGRFNPLWLAGFGTNRPATGINDPPWVRAIAMRNNGVTLVMVTIDSVGIFHNDFIDVRKAVDASLGIDHIMFSSTHVHEVPDTMKIWSMWRRINVPRIPFLTDKPLELDVPIFNFDDRWLEFVKAMSIEAVEEAVQNLAPADMYCATVRVEPEGFVRDSRLPEVMDDNMYLWRFTPPGVEEETIATFVSWGNHPEALGGRNTIITSDFPHWLREGIESGVPEPNGVEGLGGVCLYFQGQVGGLMTQLGMAVPHRDGVRMFKEDSFEKAESQGYNLAIVAVNALRDPDLVWKNENPAIHVAAKTALAKMQGHYKYAMMLGLIHEGYYWGSRAKTELNAIRIGDVVMLTIPGEIYPEIVEGGIEALPGRDFEIDPVEVPPLRQPLEAHARQGMVIGLANDQIGYIIPKSQWDAKPPYIYNDRPQYGEGNSGGPEVGPMIHAVSMELLERINSTF